MVGGRGAVDCRPVRPADGGCAGTVRCRDRRPRERARRSAQLDAHARRSGAGVRGADSIARGYAEWSFER